MSAKLVVEITGPYADEFLKMLKQDGAEDEIQQLCDDASFDLCRELGVDTRVGLDSMNHCAHEIKFLMEDGKELAVEPE